VNKAPVLGTSSQRLVTSGLKKQNDFDCKVSICKNFSKSIKCTGQRAKYMVYAKKGHVNLNWKKKIGTKKERLTEKKKYIYSMQEGKG
jgi:hypothetical protein